MRIEVDVDKCISSGACALEAPTYFTLDDDGIVVVLDSEPADGDMPEVDAAVAACPAAVIRLLARK